MFVLCLLILVNTIQNTIVRAPKDVRDLWRVMYITWCEKSLSQKICHIVHILSQAFDRAWHEGLLFKIKNFCFTPSFLPILRLYLHKRRYEVKFNNEVAPLNEIFSGVPQWSILGTILDLLFTADLPTHAQTTTATYADDTAVLSTNINPAIASANIQTHIHELEKWLDNWRTRDQPRKIYVTFNLKS